SQNSVEVPVTSLDDFFIDKDIIIDVLKIDTEGADTWVLQGAEGLLRSHKIRHIFFEENATRMAALGLLPGEAQAFLQSCGYQVERLGGNDWSAHL
ncbi:MAG TPA: FkbM family methyltransferase, partial [Phormidium sp.]